MALEIVHCGNGKTALHTLARVREAKALDRVIIGNDAPSGTGVVPLGILRVIAHLTSLGGIEPEEAICMATGNTARVYGLPVGVIEPGREADLCIVDAPVGSVGRTAQEALRAGDLFGISMVLIDGQIRIGRSRNTPPAARAAEVIKGHGAGGGGH
jgi:enamidase